METVHVNGASLLGSEAERVVIEALLEPKPRSGRVEIQLSGLPDAVTRESRGRLLCALRENGLDLPHGRLFLNLIPAARPKSGEILDLPLVLAAATAARHLPPTACLGTMLLGEVGIDGSLHPVPGGLPVALAARDAGLQALIGPGATAREAACVPGVRAHAAKHVKEVIGHLTGGPERLQASSPPQELEQEECGNRLDEVRGHQGAKRALAIAAAGGHGLLLVGPPGIGKSMLARGLVELRTPPDLEERLEITGVLSAAGRWPGGLATHRPFRAPHHSATQAGMVGGGTNMLPGEVSLAHRGVLFLDELPEFRREVLEALRTPLESGSVLLSRAGRQQELPGSFQLVAAMNPCPCGYRGHPRRICSCAPGTLNRYRNRVSGPLLDRIELRLELGVPAVEELTGALLDGPSKGAPRAEGPRTCELRAGVRSAEETRVSRGQNCDNAHLETSDLDRVAPIEGEGLALLARAIEQRVLSARAIQSIRRVARTVADMDGEELPGPGSVAQALALRGDLPP